MKVVLNDGCTVLDLSEPDDLMKYHICLESKFVANSEKELRANKWAYAKFYIALENEAEELKYKKNEIKSSAFAKLHDQDLTITVKQKIAVILGLVSARSVLTNESIHNLLFEYIDKSEFTGTTNIDKFTELYNLLKDPKGKMDFEARYLLKQALDLKILYEKQDSYSWIKPSGSMIVGETYTEAIEFLLNPKKEALVQELKDTIKVKLS
jgi:hypothetical protein